MHARPSSRLVLRIGSWSLVLLLAHRLRTPTDLPPRPVDPPIPFDQVARGSDPIRLPAPPPPIAAPASPTPAAIAPQTLMGKAAEDALKQSGQHASLGAALQAARYAAEKIDPAGPHSRGAEYFAANPKQQLRAWFGKEGIELASGQRTDEGKAPWRLKLRFASVERVVDGVAPRAMPMGLPRFDGHLWAAGWWSLV